MEKTISAYAHQEETTKFLTNNPRCLVTRSRNRKNKVCTRRTCTMGGRTRLHRYPFWKQLVLMILRNFNLILNTVLPTLKIDKKYLKIHRLIWLLLI